MLVFLGKAISAQNLAISCLDFYSSLMSSPLRECQCIQKCGQGIAEFCAEMVLPRETNKKRPLILFHVVEKRIGTLYWPRTYQNQKPQVNFVKQILKLIEPKL